MFLIEDCINALLRKHSCVVVPGFGGFVAKRIPSKINFEEGVLHPPKKEILFNPNLKEDDGLLKHYMVSALRKEYSFVENLLAEKSASWNKLLDQGQSVDFKDLGELFKHDDRRFVFIQNDYSNHLLDAYGLEDIRFQPLVEVTQSTEDPKGIDKRESHSIYATLAKYAAVLILGFVGFYSYWIPAHTNVLKSGMIHWSDLNPFQSQAMPVYSNHGFEEMESIEKSPSEKPVEKEFLHGESVLAAESPLSSKEEEAEVKPETPTPTPTPTPSYVAPNNTYSMKVVVGCFAEEKNISRFLQKLATDGFTPFREKHGKLTRICILATNNVEDANKAVEKSRTFGYKGWVLK